MIVVAEGPSAAGKTTWSRRVGGERVIAEAGLLDPSVVTSRRADGTIGPPPDASPEDAAAYWVEVNATRWTMAVNEEAGGHTVVCDTDPLKLHYDYSLAMVGIQDWARFDVGVEHNHAAIGEGRIGLADLFCVHIPAEEVLDRHARSDLTRRRSRFALHRRLGPALLAWYGALDSIDPGRVVWAFPATLPPIAPRADRHDGALFLRWMDALPRR